MSDLNFFLQLKALQNLTVNIFLCSSKGKGDIRKKRSPTTRFLSLRGSVANKTEKVQSKTKMQVCDRENILEITNKDV